MNAGMNQSMSWITGNLSTNLNALQGTGKMDQCKAIKGSLFYDMITQSLSQKNEILDPLRSTQENQEIFEIETDNKSNLEFVASIELNNFISETLIASDSRSDLLQGIKENEIMNELEVNEIISVNSVFSNLNDNYIILNSNSNPVKSISNSNPVKSISNDNSVGTSSNVNPVFTISNVNPVFTISSSKPFFSGSELVKDVAGLQETTSEKTISNSLKECNIASKAIENIPGNNTEQVQGVALNNDLLETQTREIEKLEPYGQIGKEILSKLEQKSPMEFKMQLEPEDLGKIDIKLKLNEGKLIIDIIASNSKTQALLTSQVDKLVQSMGLQNVLVESIQVNQQINPQLNQQGQENQNLAFAMNSGMNFSQKKQQEQMQEQFMKQKNLQKGFNPLNDGNQGIDGIRSIGLRDLTRKMDYAV